MRFSYLLGLLATASLVTAKSAQHVGKRMPEADVKARSQAERHFAERAVVEGREPLEKRAKSPFLNSKSKKFVVNGTSGAIPEVDFDIGESYAGLLPISSKPKEKSELYFWFFSSENKLAGDEILIWLNGGPGCSSLEGFLQENGPFLWQYGTYKPVKNPWTWVNLTNVVWVEQPIGTGFSQRTPTATSEKDVAAQFLGFWKNFVDTFNLHGKKVYISGESYAGYYVPYIADAMFNKKDKNYYNMDSILIYDPSLSSNTLQGQIPAVPFVNYWGPLLSLNDSFVANITATANHCGYTKVIDEYLVFPPKGPLPTPPNVEGDDASCDVFDAVFSAASLVNPCFDIYQVATTCPLLWDILGFPDSFDYVPDGANIYFNRSDVQKAINAPPTDWAECTSVDVFVNGTDNSPPFALSVLPSVIERTNRTIIGHGLLDMILIYNGTLLAIQNMTWLGEQGFRHGPDAFNDFYVPYHNELNLGTIAGSGVMGKTHTERKLTIVTVTLSRHMVPQYAPSAAYRQLEFLLGRIESLDEVSPFTTQPGVIQP